MRSSCRRSVSEAADVTREEKIAATVGYGSRKRDDRRESPDADGLLLGKVEGIAGLEVKGFGKRRHIANGAVDPVLGGAVGRNG